MVRQNLGSFSLAERPLYSPVPYGHLENPRI